MADALLDPLFRFCLYRVGRNRHLCEEVVQETLVRALRNLDHYDPPRANNNIFPWIAGLARNEIHRVLNRERATISLEKVWARMDRELLSLYARLDAEPFADEVLLREETRGWSTPPCRNCPPTTARPWKRNTSRARASATWQPCGAPPRRPSNRS